LRELDANGSFRAASADRNYAIVFKFGSDAILVQLLLRAD